MEFLNWDEAKGQADQLGLIVSGTYRSDGTPVYFLQRSEEADTAEVAFEHRHGRPMGGYEQFIAKVAERLA